MGNLSAEVLKDLAEFLRCYQWFFNFSNVRTLELNVFDTFPFEWRQFLRNGLSVAELKNILTGNARKDIPEFVIDFVNLRNRCLQSVLDAYCSSFKRTQSLLISANLKKGMTPKKVHEVEMFSQCVNETVGDLSRQIVDVGSGLGYVSQVLATNWNHSVIGIEGNSSHSERALTRGTKSQTCVKTINFHLSGSDESTVHLERLLPDHENFYLIGLHACGDLTSSIMKWFRHSPKVSGMSVVSCCYHKIKQLESFPVSKELESVITDLNDPLRSIFAKRLASQDPFETWLKSTNFEHQEHAKVFGRRCIVELLASKNNLEAKKTRRKLGKSGNGTLSEIINENFQFRHKTNGDIVQNSVIHEKISSVYQTYETNLVVLELLTGLQSFLQLPLELLILCDKILHLQELGFRPVLKRIFEPLISPRCFLISCNK